MTQPGMQDVARHLNGQQVTAYFIQMMQRDESMRENFKACREAVLDAAQLYKDENDTEKLQKLREQLLSVVSGEHELDVHKAALSQMQRDYQPSIDPTDFSAEVQQHMDALRTHFHAERDDDVKEFDVMAGTAPAADEELGSDEELVIEGNANVNDKCPYTLKELLALKEPVEDKRGFVYEGEAVRHAIRQSRVGWVEAPAAGATHHITLRDLKPCRRVLLLQKHRQKHGVPAGAAGAGASTQRGRVLDV